MEIFNYLRMVADKIEEAHKGCDADEAVRLMNVTIGALSDTITKVEGGANEIKDPLEKESETTLSGD